ncbi:MAG: hypothetical protein QOJ12_3581 [Thermoleophilales bacterium]|jgi:type II secretory pathway component GspD/PulD (secretin)|nr:hypothetical protein [Thermoleophilales bacterium]
MKSLKRNAIRFLPLLIIPITFAIIGTRAKSAAELPPAPCKEDAMTRVSTLGKAAAKNTLRVQQKAVPRDLAILIIDGVQIITYTGPYNPWPGSLRKD